MNFLKFLRHYGPVPRNDNMYDEAIQRFARKKGITPIAFEHPRQTEIVGCFTGATDPPASVVLTGTAGDGKTHLCRQVWEALNGGAEEWASDSPILTLTPRPPSTDPNQTTPQSGSRFPSKIHFIRDLSGFAPPQGAPWPQEKEKLLQQFCASLFNPDGSEVFLIAANDGQLIESWRRLDATEEVKRTRQVFEDLLVNDRQGQPGVRLRFFNLSRSSSAEMFDLLLPAFLGHRGWEEMVGKEAGPSEFFGPRCPICHNYELLQTPLVRSRLRALLELCDYNGLHVPIRQLLLLLANAILGHPDVKDHLMVPADIPKIIAAGTISKASLYNNIFGGNLSESRRQSITIFDYLERFQIGYETSNRVDNMLIFGDHDEHLGQYFDQFIARDEFYGADAMFYGAKRDYVEGSDEGEERTDKFLEMLVSQRRGLFFKIPREQESELPLWELTAFKFAGEYLEAIFGPLRKGETVKGSLLTRLIKGLNRVFTGMLMTSERSLYLATSGNHSQAKVSRILVEYVSAEPSKGEKIVLRYDRSNGQVIFSVYFAPDLSVDFNLTLVRYEFLSRIAVEGALPASFSKECYEDLLAFKSQLIATHAKREALSPEQGGPTINLKLLTLTERGSPEPQTLEVIL